MHTPQPYPQSFTVFYYSGYSYTYKNIFELIDDLWVVRDNCYRRWADRCKYQISNGFDLTCDRCRQPINNSELGRNCVVERYVVCDSTGEQIIEREYYKHHDVRSCIIIRDRDTGEAYSEHDLAALYYEATGGRPRRRKDWSRWDNIRQIEKRNLKKRYNGHSDVLRYFRSFRTANEIRQYEAAFVEDVKPKIRARRNPTNLPHVWDDCYSSVHGYAKNWKTQRIRKQWMVNLDLKSKGGSVVDD